MLLLRSRTDSAHVRCEVKGKAVDMNSVQGILKGCAITGIATAVPERVVGNDELKAFFGKDERSAAHFDKVIGNIRVKERHHGLRISTGELALAAVERLREAGLWSPEEISAIVFVSQTPNAALPTTANQLHGKLGLPKACLAFDINQGCAGFVYGAHAVFALLQTFGRPCKALLVGGDCNARGRNTEAGRENATLSDWALFGDAGFAAVLSYDPASSETVAWSLGSDGMGAQALYTLGHSPTASSALFPKPEEITSIYGHMDGEKIFEFTMDTVPDELQAVAALDGRDMEPADYARVFLHQANVFILKHLAMLANVPRSNLPISMDRYGNTSSASIPLTMCDLYSTHPECDKPERVLMCGFGVGLSWGTMALDIDPSCCLPIILVHEEA